MKEHFHHHNVDKDKESLRNEVTKVKKQIVSGEHIAQHQRSELKKLTRIIQEADEERQRQVRWVPCAVPSVTRTGKTRTCCERMVLLSNKTSERPTTSFCGGTFDSQGLLFTSAAS